ncbi:MAG: hypothetical protein M1812_000163 [Candelaria pacifica]|nr:MAG: hypothetical protein M1812_000163 [Candelaria pacifica]
MVLFFKRISILPRSSKAQWLSGLCVRCRRKYTTASTLISEGDIVLLRQTSRDNPSPILSKPLSHGTKIHSHQGTLNHSDVIGKRVRDGVSFSRGRGVVQRIHWPTLAEYVELTPRIVTPVYPADANLIVSLLDIHPSLPTELSSSSPQSSKFEILEAGTGHGALTLHLARAIHAANPPPLSSSLKPDTQEYDTPGDRVSPLQEVGTTSMQSEVIHNPEDGYDTDAGSNQQSDYVRWKATRGAIVHTIDISAKHSTHAQRIVGGFRRGMYVGSIDFYTGDVSKWIEEQLRKREPGDPFLAHVVLDLPSTHTHLDNVASALRVDGLLAVFNPNITQITKCVEVIREKRLPFVLDRVVELGGSTGGREWDVRPVKPRALLKAEKEKKLAASEQSTSAIQVQNEEGAVLAESGAVESSAMACDEKSRAEEYAEPSIEKDSGWEMICRPKVGDRLVGGGFLGLWRRMRHTNDPEK